METKQPLKPLTILSGRGSLPVKPPPPPSDDDQHELLANALGRLQTALQDDDAAKQILSDALRTNKIASWVWGSTFIRLSDSFWVAGQDKIAERLQKSLASWTSTSDQWLFVDRRAIDNLLLKRSRPVSSPFGFEMTRNRWPLFDACIWAATNGAETTTDAIVDQRLDDRGAVKLFEALADQPLLDGVSVFGFLPGLNSRAAVPPDNWDSAHTGYRDNGNEILFYQKEDRTPGDERQYVAADMHRHKLLGPSFVDLWIRRDDLFALFPRMVTTTNGGASEPTVSTPVLTVEDAASNASDFVVVPGAIVENTDTSHTPPKTGSLKVRCQKELEKEIRAHPYDSRDRRRWKTRDAFVTWAVEQGLGSSQARDCWNAAMRDLAIAEFSHTWSNAGAPRKSD